MKGRSIIDILLMWWSEATIKTQVLLRCTVKVDLMKAYDYLFEAMAATDFPAIFTK